ncbi:spore coat protein [candidate division LCP-89 bacterium B3_LCP]|uniref:glucose-1-phosphate thymidylyltransferase n=1 Tax=candidate division LCP-89 bacterium B3_LCP TaxID=2012998 RepID=A0A532V527_UNCL8|nr:MAG: spore coat protein [candidate division LCP-89 bacterium B3_LCP]
MKGIVLAGGSGTRLFPLTKVTNKHLLPVGQVPMIYHPILKLLEAGITEILIVTGVEHMGHVVGLLGSGGKFGCEFTYKVQDQAGGIAQALGLAKHFAFGDRMVVILGDNIFVDPITEYVKNFAVQKAGARIIIKQVEDPERFGVAELDGDKVKSISEKPSDPKSNYAVTGVYMYDSQVFEIITNLQPSDRGELEITDVNNAYIKLDQLNYDVFENWWTDAGTFESLHVANELLRNNNLSHLKYAPKADTNN